MALPPAWIITSRRTRVLGFALAGGGTNWALAQNLGTGRSDAFQAGVYGITHFGPAYFSGALAFANNWFTTNRIARSAISSPRNSTARATRARVEAGYRFAVPLHGCRRHALCGLAGARLPHAELQRDRSHRRRLRAVLQRA